MKRKKISAVQLSADEVDANPAIFKEIRDGRYQLVYTPPEMILKDGARFTKEVLRAKDSSFVKRLMCIAIDEAHVAWSWRLFRPEYNELAVMRFDHPKVPFLILSATLALNMLGYLHVQLNLRNKTRIYRISIDRKNITQIVSPIRTPDFTALDWFLGINVTVPLDIPKTMIFVDDINEGEYIVEYLRFRLPNNLKVRGRASDIIRPYNASLSWDTRAVNLEVFKRGSARVLVCTDAAGMGVDIPDIEVVIQWKISKHLSLASLVQRIGRAGRDDRVKAVAVTMAEERYFLPKGIVDTESSLAELTCPVSGETEEKTKAIIGGLYVRDPDTGKRSRGASTPYANLDPALVWLINTTGCRSRLIMANFVDRDAFNGERASHCCDNCVYASANPAPSGCNKLKTPDFERCGINMKVSKCFDDTEDAFRQEIDNLSRRNAMGPPRAQNRTSAVQTQRCLHALNEWATNTWPHSRKHHLTFPPVWRQKIARHALQIRSVSDLYHKLGNDVSSVRSSLLGLEDTIVSLVVAAVDADDESESERQSSALDGMSSPILLTPSPPRNADTRATVASTTTALGNVTNMVNSSSSVHPEPPGGCSGVTASLRNTRSFSSFSESAGDFTGTAFSSTPTFPPALSSSRPVQGSAEFTGSAIVEPLHACDNADLGGAAALGFSRPHTGADFTGAASPYTVSPRQVRDNARFTGTAFSSTSAFHMGAGNENTASPHHTLSFGSLRATAAEFTGTATSDEDTQTAASATTKNKRQKKTVEEKVQSSRDAKESRKMNVITDSVVHPEAKDGKGKGRRHKPNK